jgi:hypothetical protein
MNVGLSESLKSLTKTSLAVASLIVAVPSDGAEEDVTTSSSS